MSWRELTAEQVREELALLIAKYPERNGRARSTDGSGQPVAVYYITAEGEPVNAGWWDEEYCVPNHQTMDLVTPVCIVGQWVEDFHPQLKEDEAFNALLLKNQTIHSNRNDAAKTLAMEVVDLLAMVQNQQDSGLIATWDEIRLR